MLESPYQVLFENDCEKENASDSCSALSHRPQSKQSLCSQYLKSRWDKKYMGMWVEQFNLLVLLGYDLNCDVAETSKLS